jgi:hypothetical protein
MIESDWKATFPAAVKNILLRNRWENRDFKYESKQSRAQKLLAASWHTLTRLRNNFTSIINLYPSEGEAIKKSKDLTIQLKGQIRKSLGGEGNERRVEWNKNKSDRMNEIKLSLSLTCKNYKAAISRQWFSFPSARQINEMCSKFCKHVTPHG